MSGNKKQSGIPVNIRHLEQAYGYALHEFEPGKTYPIAKLMDALGFMKPGRPKGLGAKIVGRRVDITLMDEPYTGEVVDPAKREKVLKWHRTYLAKIQRKDKEEKETR